MSIYQLPQYQLNKKIDVRQYDCVTNILRAKKYQEYQIRYHIKHPKKRNEQEKKPSEITTRAYLACVSALYKRFVVVQHLNSTRHICILCTTWVVWPTSSNFSKSNGNDCIQRSCCEKSKSARCLNLGRRETSTHYKATSSELFINTAQIIQKATPKIHRVNTITPTHTQIMSNDFVLYMNCVCFEVVEPLIHSAMPNILTS